MITMDECDLCMEGFKKASKLREHMKTHIQASNNEQSQTACYDNSVQQTASNDKLSTVWSFSEETKQLEPLQNAIEVNLSDTNQPTVVKNESEPPRSKLYRCKACKIRFPKVEFLRMHKQIYHKYKCDICNKRFPSSSQLQTHKSTHPTREHQCQICHKVFKQAKNLKGHLATHSGERPYECSLCAKTYTRPGHLKDHMLTHSGIKPYQCQDCGKTFSRSTHLNQHAMIHLNVKPYSCDICDKQFSFAASLKRHMISHSSVKKENGQVVVNVSQATTNPVVVVNQVATANSANQVMVVSQGMTNQGSVIYDNSTWQEGMLNALQSEDIVIDQMLHHNVIQNRAAESYQIHQIEANPAAQSNQSVTVVSAPNTYAIQQLGAYNPSDNKGLSQSNNKAHMCNICGKSFTRSSSLKIHNLIHLGIKPHKCNICNKTFTQLAALNLHSLTHTGEKKHKCTICNKAFNRAGNLKTHMVVHTGAKDYKCDQCGKAFGRPQHLSDHKKTHNTSMKTVRKCDVCQAEFSDYKHLKDHMATHVESGSQSCHICDKSFSMAGHLKKHILLSHKSNKPAYKYIVKKYTKHLRGKDTSEPQKCEICNKTYSSLKNLKSHLKIHSGERKYKCDMCHKSYTRSNNLKEHMYTHTGVKPFKCSVCSKEFSRSNYHREHMISHFNMKPYSCEVCNKKLATSGNLKRHMLTHASAMKKSTEKTQNKKLVVYDAGLNAVQGGEQSEVTIHGGDTAQAAIQVQGTTSIQIPGTMPNAGAIQTVTTLQSGGMLNALHAEDLAIDHMLQSVVNTSQPNEQYMTYGNMVPVNSLSNPFSVVVSGTPVSLTTLEAPPQTNQLVTPSYSSNNIGPAPPPLSNPPSSKPHQCNVCFKTFTRASGLKMHNLIHLGIKPHKCNYCNKEFTQLAALNHHKLTHTGVKAFQCNICFKSFNRAGNLKTHSVVHTGVKAFKCDVCGKAFSRSHHLTDHKKTHMDGDTPYRCNVCQHECKDYNRLKEHMKTHITPKIFQCSICDKLFNLDGDLKVHMTIEHVSATNDLII